MFEVLEPYSTRFQKRFRKDATAWARDNIIWGFIVLIGPPLAMYLRDPHAQIDWGLVRTTIALYIVALTVYVIVHLCRTAKKLDMERDARETALLGDIKERDETIRALSEKPKRTVAEQHHYDIAKKALQKLNPDTIVALRHLKTQGKITFGTYPPFLPPGISVNRLVDIYLECSREGLVARQDDSQKGERTFEIAPTMNVVLDELLYEDGAAFA
jgi:hypothetical protein